MGPIHICDEQGRELPRDQPGVAGEVVGRSGAMMTGYHKQPAKTAEAEWFDESWKRSKALRFEPMQLAVIDTGLDGR